MIYLKAFVAGFASTPVFHQGLLWLLYAAGAANQMTSPRPWCCSRPTTAATSPEGVVFGWRFRPSLGHE